MKFNQHTNLKKIPYIIYADLECLVKKKERMYKQSTVPCKYSIPPSWVFYYILLYFTIANMLCIVEKIV